MSSIGATTAPVRAVTATLEPVSDAPRFAAWLSSALVRFSLAACLIVASQALWAPSVQAEEPAPLPLRVLPMPLGTLCSGVLPSCARNGDTGLHLRIGMLAGLRGDRSVGWVQGDVGFLISVMRWAEVGVYLPVTWFGSIRPTLQPLRFGGKVAYLSPARWQRLGGSAFTEVRIAKGPFSGAGSPLGEQPTAIDVGLTLETRVWLFQAQGIAWLTGAQTGLELHAGVEAGFRGDSISPFIQARLDSRPGCPPSENPLCGIGGAVVGGLRGSFDAVAAAPFAGVGQGSGHAFVLAGLQTGLSFDVDFVQRHGDGSAQAQAWWERRLASLRQAWSEQHAQREYGPIQQRLERQRQAVLRRLGERSGVDLATLPRPEEALRMWRDAVLSEQVEETPPGELLAASTIAELREQMAARRQSQTKRRLYRALIGRPVLHRDEHGYPELALQDAGIAWERFAAEQGALFEELERARREREQAQRVPYKPLVILALDKAVLNAVGLAPFELLAPFFYGSPEAVADMARLRRKLRWMPYTEDEQEQGEVLEAAYQAIFALGAGLASGAGRAAGLATTRGALRAAEAELAVAAARAAEPTAASTSTRLLSRITDRLNPSNYALDGLGSNFGNVRFRPPRRASLSLSEAAEAEAGEALHTESAAPVRAPKVHDGKQGKHIPGHNNYQEGRSILSEDPHELAKQAGSGEQVGPYRVGTPGSKERIDFGKVIGEFVDENTGERIRTTKGMIVYSKEGVHIYPVRP